MIDLLNTILLEAVYERDIDLLLLEELHSNPIFFDWIINETIKVNNFQFLNAWHSINDKAGEADLVILFEVNKIKTIFLIENKIDAQFQPDQAFRYKIHGDNLLQNNECLRYYTILFAPIEYLKGNNDFDYYIAYERIREWFTNCMVDNQRANYKAKILTFAIEKQRRKSPFIPNKLVVRFWIDFYNYLMANHPHLGMRKPHENEGSTTRNLYPKGIGLRKSDYIYYNTTGYIDIQLFGMIDKINEIKEKYKKTLPKEIYIEPAGKKSIAFRIYLDKVEITESFKQQIPTIEIVFSKAEILYNWAKNNLNLDE